MTSRTGTAPIHKPPALGPAAGWLPLAIVLVGTFVDVLDFFIVNVALPSIQGDLNASAAAVEWVVAGYGLAAAICLVPGGRLGDRYGRRFVFTLGLAGFVVTSGICALAPNESILVSGRLAQGVTVGLLMPNVLSIINVTYQGAHGSRAVGIYAMVMGLAASAGQLIGGVLIGLDVAGLGWRSIFWINVPIGLLALAVVNRIPESRADQPGRVDWRGVALLAAGLTALLLPLLDGRQQGWPLWSWLVLALAAPMMVAFCRHELRVERSGGDALLSPRILARRGPATGLVIQVLFFCQQAASYLFLALYLQRGRGLSPVVSGLLFTALVAGYLLTSSRAPALTARFGRRVVVLGALVAAGGDGLLALAVTGGDITVFVLIPGLFVLGAGQGLGLIGLTTSVLGFATPSSVGTLSGALTTCHEIGNALGVGLLGVIFYSAVPSGYATAFGRTLVGMAVLLVVVAGLGEFLRERDAAATEPPGIAS